MLYTIGMFKTIINHTYQDSEEVIYSVTWDRRDIEQALTQVNNSFKDYLVISNEFCKEIFNRASQKCEFPGLSMGALIEAIEDYLADKVINFAKKNIEKS